MSEGLMGYKVLSKRHTPKSVLYFVRRWGKKYVVKEYTDYRFPDSSHGKAMPDALKRAEQRAAVYFMHLQKVARLMRRSLRQDGLINIPLDVFRKDRLIYKVSRELEACGIEFEQLHEHVTPEEMNVFLRTLLAQLEELERIGFIHCDLKPENVMVCRGKRKGFSAAVIDCDSGIIMDHDDTHYVDYTPEYAAPEMHIYKMNEDEPEAQELRRTLSCAADMFSAACLIVLCLTGEILDKKGMIPADVLSGEEFLWVPKIHPVWRTLVRQTLHIEPQRRLKASQFMAALVQAEKSGLMKELEKPFEGCGEGKIIECARQQVLLTDVWNASSAVWYLDDCWMSDDNVQRGDVLQEHNAKARSRRQAVQHICEQMNALRSGQDALCTMRTKEVGHRFFVEQQFPEGKVMRLQEIAGKISQAEADRFICDLLRSMMKLREQGLNFCLMDVGDVWAVRQKDGRLMPVLGGLHRLVKTDKLPEREEMDVYPQIAAPEVCMYLGQNEAQNRALVAEIIGQCSEIFSLGSIYHMLLSGDIPELIDECEQFIGEAVRNAGDAGAALMLSGSIDRRRRELILDMLAYEPEERPQSFEAVLERIEGSGRRTRSVKEEKASEKTPEKGKASGWENVGDESEWREVSDEDELAELEDTEEAYEEGADDESDWIEISDEDELAELEDEDTEELYEEDANDESDWIEAPLAEVMAELEDADDETLDREEDEAGWIEADSEDVLTELEDADDESAWEDAERNYVLLDADGVAHWRQAACAEGIGRVWEHCTGRSAETDGEQYIRLNNRIARRTRKLAQRYSGIVPVKYVCSVDGEQISSVIEGDYELSWSMADEQRRAAVDVRMIDESMQTIVKGVQAAHEDGLLCGAVTAENVVVLGSELKINIAEQSFIEGDEQDIRLWSKWMKPWLDETRWDKNAVRAYLSPEAERFLGGAEEVLTKASDIFSLGILYHVFWCGRLPEADGSEGGWDGAQIRVDESIPFAQRRLIERMLSPKVEDRPQSCEKVIFEIESIIRKRGKTHSVTIKRDGIPVAGQQALLYTMIDEQERFVAETVTDRQGRAVFNGCLPEGKYYVRCGGEKVSCRWRNF